MILHRRTHPRFVEGCDACRWLTVGIASRALATKGKAVVTIEEKEKAWKKDGAAYKALRRQGFQPQSIDGADKLAATATCPEQIETGLNVSEKKFKDFESIFGFKATEPQVKQIS